VTYTVLQLRQFFRKTTKYRLLATPFEFFFSILWVIRLRTTKQADNRLPKLNFDHFYNTSSSSETNLVLLDRNFGLDGFSGVTNWVEQIAKGKYKNTQIYILCQSRNLFRAEFEERGNLVLVSLPIFFHLKLKKLPLYAAWTTQTKTFIERFFSSKNTIIIGSISGLETSMINTSQFNTYTLLVTDHRRNRYPTYSLDELRDISKLDYRSQMIALNELKILSNPNMKFIADSHAIIKDYELLYDLNLQSRSHKLNIPHGLAKLNYEASEKENIIFFVGRCDQRKNLSSLLLAWKYSKSQLQGWKLIIATSGGDDSYSHDLLNTMAMNDTDIIILWDVDNITKNRIFRKSKIVCVPSWYESFGIVIAEATLNRCYVIAGKAGGMPEVAIESYSRICEPDWLCLAYNLVTAVTDFDSYSLSENDWSEWVKNFSIEECANELSKILF
jgi:glycosyltransferase involved in cell wall biosynthesis